MDDKEIADLLKQCNEGKITLQELQKKLAEGGSTLKAYDKRTERNPSYPEGNNGSRNGFTYNPNLHPKGKYFQYIVKPAIRAAIDFAHGAITKYYDKDAYKYDDSRLQAWDTYLVDFIDKNFNGSGKQDKLYKSDFMLKIKDIVLFLMKEDIYYRPRFIMLINGIPEVGLMKEELDNIERWH